MSDSYVIVKGALGAGRECYLDFLAENGSALLMDIREKSTVTVTLN